MGGSTYTREEFKAQIYEIWSLTLKIEIRLGHTDHQDEDSRQR